MSESLDKEGDALLLNESSDEQDGHGATPGRLSTRSEADPIQIDSQVMNPDPVLGTPQFFEAPGHIAAKHEEDVANLEEMPQALCPFRLLREFGGVESVEGGNQRKAKPLLQTQ